MVSDLEARGVAFSSLNEAIDTGSARDKLIFRVFASSRLRVFASSRLRVFASSRLRGT